MHFYIYTFNYRSKNNKLQEGCEVQKSNIQECGGGHLKAPESCNRGSRTKSHLKQFEWPPASSPTCQWPWTPSKPSVFQTLQTLTSNCSGTSVALTSLPWHAPIRPLCCWVEAAPESCSKGRPAFLPAVLDALDGPQVDRVLDLGSFGLQNPLDLQTRLLVPNPVEPDLWLIWPLQANLAKPSQ